MPCADPGDVRVGKQSVFIGFVDLNDPLFRAVYPQFRTVGKAYLIFAQFILLYIIGISNLGKHNVSADDTVIAPAGTMGIGVSQKRILCHFFASFSIKCGTRFDRFCSILARVGFAQFADCGGIRFFPNIRI